MSSQANPSAIRLNTRSWTLALAAIGLVGLAISTAGYFLEPTHTLHAYLVALMYGLTIVLGMGFFTILQHLTDAGWSSVVRRPAEQFLAGLPVLAILTIVYLSLCSPIYEWMHLDPKEHPLLAAKSLYLNKPFFFGRSAFYLICWLALGCFYRGQSLKQDLTGRAETSLTLRRFSGPAMILFAFTLTFASIDWLMTLQYEWFSTIFGVYVFAGAAASSLSLLAILVMRLKCTVYAHHVAESHLHDLGKLVFAFCVFWAYIAFSQWVLIWYANLPEETGWMMQRWQGPWKPMIVSVVGGTFVLPFLLLMSARNKKRPMTLIPLGVLVLIVHYLDLYWLIMPTLLKSSIRPEVLWIELGTLATVIGLTGAAIAWAMGRSSMVPLNDPRLHEAMAAMTPHHA